MPHYADGKEARVGDFVIAPCFNTEGKIAGTIVSITPGSEACNAKIRFTLVKGVDEAPPRMHVGPATLARSEQHGAMGPMVAVWSCEDYCDTGLCEKVG